MDRCLYVFNEPLTQKDEIHLVRDVTAVDFKRETDAPFDLLPSIISFIRDDVDLFGITIYSLREMSKTSLLEYRNKRPLYRLKLDNDLMAFIIKSASLINKFDLVSSCICELDDHLRSYAYELNEAVGVDAKSFSVLGEMISDDPVGEERLKLAELIGKQLAMFAA